MNQKLQKARAARGVTLIELMIVVAVVAVLAAIAYPSYTKFMTETNRSDAHIALSKLANDMDKYYSECGDYTSSITSAGRSCPPGGSLGRQNALSPNAHYQLSVTLVSSGYTLTAIPLGGQLVADTECTTLSVANTGATSATGSNPSRCWRK